MTQKEKQIIVAEIERRISADDARGRTLREVASFISSIPTEDYPMPEDTVIFQKGVAEGRRLEREDMPKWTKVETGQTLAEQTSYLLSTGQGFYFVTADFITRDGYALFAKDLEKLPKEEEV